MHGDVNCLRAFLKCLKVIQSHGNSASFPACVTVPECNYQLPLMAERGKNEQRVETGWALGAGRQLWYPSTEEGMEPVGTCSPQT